MEPHPGTERSAMIARSSDYHSYNIQTRAQRQAAVLGCNELETPLFLLIVPLGRVFEPSLSLSVGCSSGLDEGGAVSKKGSELHGFHTPGGLPTTWVALPPKPGESWVQFPITTLYPLGSSFFLFCCGGNMFFHFYLVK